MCISLRKTCSKIASSQWLRGGFVLMLPLFVAMAQHTYAASPCRNKLCSLVPMVEKAEKADLVRDGSPLLGIVIWLGQGAAGTPIQAAAFQAGEDLPGLAFNIGLMLLGVVALLSGAILLLFYGIQKGKIQIQNSDKDTL